MSKLLKPRNAGAHKHPKKPINRRTTVEEEDRVSKPGSMSSPKMPSLVVDDAASSHGVHENENAADFRDCEVQEEQASVQGSCYHEITEPEKTCNCSRNWNFVNNGTGVEEDEEPGFVEIDNTSNRLRGIRFSNGGFQVDFLIVKN